MKNFLIVFACSMCMASSTIQPSEIDESKKQGTSQVYIDRVYKFEDNNTFYVDERDALIATAEEEIFSGDDVTRTLIPERVRSLFQLQGLSNITIYNKENVKLTKGKYSHIEYVQDLIEDKFVAVFEVEDPEIEGFVFCVGDQKKDLTPITYTEYTDEKLNVSLVNYLKKSNSAVGTTKHYKFNQSIYSAISLDTTAYIVETIGQNYKTLYTSKHSETISNLTIISKNANNKPVLLAECGQPDTDMMWTSVLTFNGTKYQPVKNHLIKE